MGMRRSINSCETIEFETPDGPPMLVGLNLGFDFVAEHEFGYRWATENLGRPVKIDREHVGVPARMNTKHEMRLELVERNGEVWFYARPPSIGLSTDRTLADQLADVKKAEYIIRDVMLEPVLGADIRAAWNDRDGFIVVGQSDKGNEGVRLVHEALLVDACLIDQRLEWAGRGGLCLIDTRRLPQTFFERQKETDIGWLDLQDAAMATGVAAKLTAAGKKYYTLEPAWANAEKTAVHFYLNPHDQTHCRYGWFNVRQLEEWARDEGPVLKKNKFDEGDDGRQ